MHPHIFMKMLEMYEKYLNFTTKSLNFMFLWVQRDDDRFKTVKDYLTVSLIISATLPITVDFIVQFAEDDLSLTNINENLVAMSALYGMIYLNVCFIKNKKLIKNLVDDLEGFEHFGEAPNLIETDNTAALFTKTFLIYGITGNLCYAAMPLLSLKQCMKNRPEHMIKYGIPCGLVTRCMMPFKFDFSPLMELVLLHQILVCLLCTIIFIFITMLLCGLLMHARTQLRYLTNLLLSLSEENNVRIEDKVTFCVKFHIKIINFSFNINEAFSTMMLLHVTLTGFIMSVLGLEIIMVNNISESTRFIMHLAGWLFMLFIVSYYGQVLMDESTELAKAVYSTLWYKSKVSVQKDICFILARAQKPLTLKAANIGVMSLSTFLGVMKSAYSCFTLLLKLKN